MTLIMDKIAPFLKVLVWENTMLQLAPEAKRERRRFQFQVLLFINCIKFAIIMINNNIVEIQRYTAGNGAVWHNGG